MVVSKSFLDVVLETDLSLTLEVVSELFLEVVSKLFLLEVVSEGYSIYSSLSSVSLPSFQGFPATGSVF